MNPITGMPMSDEGRAKALRYSSSLPSTIERQCLAQSPWVGLYRPLALRIWNEADVRVVSETGLRVTSIDFPKDADMPAGTYFWSIVAMRGDDAIAESGLAAFVVQKP